MSGDLKDPRRSVRLGTLWAVEVSLVTYLLVGYWLARSASQKELAANYTIPKGEPRNAMIVIGALILGSPVLRNPNAVAPLITPFFPKRSAGPATS